MGMLGRAGIGRLPSAHSIFPVLSWREGRGEVAAAASPRAFGQAIGWCLLVVAEFADTSVVDPEQ